ncbi:transporter substrate-binding domain-containing protein [Mesorhizobium sp. CGMCC 1.15528]|uniref:Transporter substrate-binding domain-containing protein n=1 Tax=Mesorhizobium zhangyense TaxID=1776730 RepID=A0A7C9V984_9HYPH|nr:transporter substrate-binding domain-containing protein [Mesorhizobium zhangyense]NGN43564.1 transporter substrate-binding domain-containing protein [Mesorhizobium zhangyense]
MLNVYLNKVSRKLALWAAAVTIASASAFASVPAAVAQTVEEIKQAGVLKVGSQVAQVPWGFTDPSGKLTGFDIELCRMVAEDLGVEAQFTPVTSSNRVATLLTGQVDMLAAVMGIFADRQKVVLFARPYVNNDTVFIGRSDLNVKGYDGLSGLRVGVPRGTPQDISVTQAKPAGATIQRFDDDATTIQALLSGQVDIIGGASTQVGNIAKVAGEGKFTQQFVVARAFNAFAVRPQSREFADYLSDFVARKTESGELSALYKKWIGGEIAKLPATGEGPDALPVSVKE